MSAKCPDCATAERELAEARAQVDRLHDCLRYESDAHAQQRAALRFELATVRASFEGPTR